VQIMPLVVPRPTIAGITIAGTNVVLKGTSGQFGRTYCTLTSADVSRPLSQWIPVATNILQMDGNFTMTATNAVIPNARQQFYILQAR
jgi:hypothetical protein